MQLGRQVRGPPGNLQWSVVVPVGRQWERLTLSRHGPNVYCGWKLRRALFRADHRKESRCRLTCVRRWCGASNARVRLVRIYGVLPGRIDSGLALRAAGCGVVVVVWMVGYWLVMLVTCWWWSLVCKVLLQFAQIIER